jgi:hypothetical protein
MSLSTEHAAAVWNYPMTRLNLMAKNPTVCIRAEKAALLNQPQP